MYNKSAQRFDALTGLRAIAAIMVFLYHNRKYWRGWLPDFVINNLNEYHCGVTLFFVLSGFLIAYTYQENPLQSRKEYVKYILIRFVRIFPVYLIILTLNYIDNGFPVFNNAVYNYTLLKGFSDKHNLDGIPQSWSLTVELSFYVFAPLVYQYLKTKFTNAVFFQLMLLLLTFIIGYSWHFINKNPGRWLYDWLFIFDSTFFGRFIEFFAGMLLAYFVKTEHSLLNKLPKKNLTLISAILALSTVYCISLFEKDTYDQGILHIPGLLLRNGLLPMFISVLLYGLMTEKTWFSNLLSTRFAMLLGNASFIFYLVHIGYVNSKFYKLHYINDRNFILLWLISIAGYLFIEKPIYNFIRARIKKW